MSSCFSHEQIPASACALTGWWLGLLSFQRSQTQLKTLFPRVKPGSAAVFLFSGMPDIIKRIDSIFYIPKSASLHNKWISILPALFLMCCRAAHTRKAEWQQHGGGSQLWFLQCWKSLRSGSNTAEPLRPPSVTEVSECCGGVNIQRQVLNRTRLRLLFLYKDCSCDAEFSSKGSIKELVDAVKSFNCKNCV